MFSPYPSAIAAGERQNAYTLSYPVMVPMRCSETMSVNRDLGKGDETEALRDLAYCPSYTVCWSYANIETIAFSALGTHFVTTGNEKYH